MSDESQDKPTSLVGYWMGKIRREEKAHEKFREQADEAEKAYLDERADSKKNLYPIFWSNVNTLHSALFQMAPKPDVRPRYTFEGPQAQIAKQAALLVERGLTYAVDTTPFSDTTDRWIDDFLMAGLGVPWVEYDAKVQQDEAGQPVQVQLQTVSLTFVPWRRFHWEPAPKWSDVDWVAKVDYLTAPEIKKQFGQEPSGEGTRSKEKTAEDKYATTYAVYSIYYRPKRTIYVICEDFDDPLEIRKDALNLQDFYPCPSPVMSNVRSNSLTPKPDYCFYKEQCDYINRLTGRIHALTKQLKVAGFYDASLAELATLTNVEDGTLVPVANLLERLASGSGTASFDRVVAELPIRDKAAVLAELIKLRDIAKGEVYEITGISDIVRGQTVASETASAQQLKGQWAQVRIARRKRQVNEALRHVFRLMAEIMAEHFTPESWMLATGLQPDPQVLAALKTDLTRTLLIDVETDSTVAMDDQAEQEQRLGMLKEVTPFLQNLMPAVQAGQLPADLVKELLMVAVGGFKYGKTLEDVLSALPSTQQQLGQLTQQVQQGQMQAQQMQQQMEQLQQQLAQAQAPEQQAQAAKIAAEAQGAQAAVAKTGADIRLVEAKTAATVMQAQAKAMQPNALPR